MNRFAHGWKLKSALWCRKYETFHDNSIGPASRFTATKSWKSGKKPKMHEKRPISPNLLFKYCSFSLKLYTIRRRIEFRIFWANLHVFNMLRSRVINEKPVEKSSMKFRRPNGFWKGPFPWPLAIRPNCHFENYWTKNSTFNAELRGESNEITHSFVTSFILELLTTK